MGEDKYKGVNMEIRCVINCYQNDALQKNDCPPKNKGREEGLTPYQLRQLFTIPEHQKANKKLAPGQRAKSTS